MEWQGSAVEKPSRLGKVEDKRRLLQILMQELAEYTERPPHVSTIRNLQMAPQASYSCSRFGKDALVVGLVGGDDVVGAEFFLGVNAGRFAHFATAVRA